MAPTFSHTFEDLSDDGMLSIDTAAALPAKVRAEVDEHGNVWLIANREGWLHLAKVCTELGLGSYEDGYHFHQDSHFGDGESKPEISFMVENQDDA
jgi:hypothetical protein